MFLFVCCCFFSNRITLPRNRSPALNCSKIYKGKRGARQGWVVGGKGEPAGQNDWKAVIRTCHRRLKSFASKFTAPFNDPTSQTVCQPLLCETHYYYHLRSSPTFRGVFHPPLITTARSSGNTVVYYSVETFEDIVTLLSKKASLW